MPTSYEFASFQSVASASAARAPLSQRRPTSASPPSVPPFVPGGVGTHHARTPNVNPAREKKREAARGDAAVERALLNAQFSAAEDAMGALETSLQGFVADVEDSFILAAAQQAALQARVAALTGRST